MTESIYSRKQVEQWGENLKELKQQPRTDFNKKQAVEALMDIIEDTLESRSYREVAGGLSEWGLEISEGSLKKYVSTYRREHSTDDSEESPKKEKKKPSSRRNKFTQQKTQTRKEKMKASGQVSKSQSADDSAVIGEDTSKTQQFSKAETKTSMSRRLGKGRLKSENNSSRYSGNGGKPLDTTKRREAENAKKAGFIDMPEEL